MNFIVTLHDSARPKIEEIANVLENMGNRVNQRLKITGIITGSTGVHTKLTDLAKIDGVKKVEKNAKYQFEVR